MTKEKNLRMLYNNTNFDKATLVASSEDVNFPISNVQTGQRHIVWKSEENPGDSVTIKIDLTEPKNINSIVFVETNLDKIGGTVTVRAYEDENRTIEKFSETFKFQTSVIGFGDGGFGGPGFGGIPLEDFSFYPHFTKAFFWSYVSPTKYWTIEINPNNKQFYIGRIFFSNYFTPNNNFQKGWSFGLIDPSTVDRSDGGQKYTNLKERYYQVNFNLSYLTPEETTGPMLQIVNQVGVRTDMVLVLFPDRNNFTDYTTIYGRFKNVPMFQQQKNFDRYQLPIVFEESL